MPRSHAVSGERKSKIMPVSKENRPNFIYGTAWKKDATTKLVELALKSGFRAIDTANQAKHYSEKLVGDALANAAAGGLARDKLWLQTKFTPIDGQDHRLPYDPHADLGTQVKQSFASSLEHLRTDYIDSYLLHGPYHYPELGPEDFEVWAAMEEIHGSGAAKAIGISNVNLQQMEMLVSRSKIKPMMVQNRCYANRGWDDGVREFCVRSNIQYEGFSLLTANPGVFHAAEVQDMARRFSVTPAQIIFRFAHQIGMIPLTGTTDEEHMKLDLAIFGFELTAADLALMENMDR